MRFTYATYNQYCNSIDVTTFDNMLLRINCNKAEDRIVTTGCSQCALNTLAIDEPQNMPDQYWMEKCRRGQMQKILQNHGSNCKKVFQLRINLLSEYTSTAVESKRISPLCQFSIFSQITISVISNVIFSGKSLHNSFSYHNKPAIFHLIGTA